MEIVGYLVDGQAHPCHSDEAHEVLIPGTDVVLTVSPSMKALLLNSDTAGFTSMSMDYAKKMTEIM